MAKSFLFITDPLHGLNVRTDTTLALMEESSRRGIKTFACELKDIFLKDGRTHFMVGEVKLEPGYNKPPAYLFKQEEFRAEDFSIVFMRKDPPVDENYMSTLFMLSCIDEKKTALVNHPHGLLLANEKLFGQKVAPQFFTPTLVSFDRLIIEQFIKEHEKVVIKPLYGFGGAGVLVLERGDKNSLSMLELASAGFSKPIMVQKYIKDAPLGDKRIILVGGKAFGAINRVPSMFDHRANFHAGGSPERCTITARDHEIIEAISPALIKNGLHFVGIDILGGYLSEINVTSPTCVLEIENTTNSPKKLRAQIIDYMLQLIA
jgi:glutathione synthase